MSNSNAAAIRRRANIQPPPNNGSIQSKSMAPPINTKELTLPQVIALIDTRLVALEKFAKDAGSNPVSTIQNNLGDKLGDKLSDKLGDKLSLVLDDPDVGFATDVELNTVISEFNERFEILAVEINTIKDVVLKLQSFTMDVNKMLLNERIRVLSDLGEEGVDRKATFEMSQSVLGMESCDEQDTGMNLREMVKQEFVGEIGELVFSSTSV